MRAEAKVRVAGPDDWELWRDLRLEALEDTPIGFVETFEDAADKTEDDWRARMSNVPFSVLAELDGVPVGMASAFLYDERVFLGAVYVTPDWRGRGVLALLAGQVATWAQARTDRLILEVHEANERARTAYARLGFVETGATTDYPLEPGGLEVEMVLRLDAERG